MTYIDFDEKPNPGHKTRLWIVVNKNGGLPLGEIRFYPAWRKYTFWPAYQMLFDASCLQDIAKFLQDQTQEWRQSI